MSSQIEGFKLDGEFGVAVVSNGTVLKLIPLRRDDFGSEPGYEFCGYFSVIDGKVNVQVEPGHEAAMVEAGARFAEMLGPIIQQQQRELNANEDLLEGTRWRK